MRKQSSKNVIFVGVHVRRGDRSHHYTDGEQLRFFTKAFEVYRSRYNNDTSEVMFLVVSDDVSWIKVKY